MKTYVDQRIDITGKVWEDVIFDGCVLVWRDEPGSWTTLRRGEVNNCLMEGAGWPNWIRQMPGIKVVAPK